MKIPGSIYTIGEWWVTEFDETLFAPMTCVGFLTVSMWLMHIGITHEIEDHDKNE